MIIISTSLIIFPLDAENDRFSITPTSVISIDVQSEMSLTYVSTCPRVHTHFDANNFVKDQWKRVSLVVGQRSSILPYRVVIVMASWRIDLTEEDGEEEKEGKTG